MDALRKAKGAEFDRLFLTGMIQHHNGALIMVKELFDTAGAGQDAELFNFATDVDSGQRAEIRIMQTMLAKPIVGDKMNRGYKISLSVYSQLPYLLCSCFAAGCTRHKRHRNPLRLCRRV